MERSEMTATQMSTWSNSKGHGSKPCALGHLSPERHGLGPMETDTSHARKTTEPILMGPIPKAHFNLPDDPDTTTTTAAAPPSEETMSRRDSTAVSAPGAATTETTSETTTSPARALVQRVGNEAGEESHPVHMRRIAALMVECGFTTTAEYSC